MRGPAQPSIVIAKIVGTAQQVYAVSEHLTTCEHARHITDLHNLYDNINDLKPNKPFGNFELIANNTKILQSLQHTNSNILLFLEALYIKLKGQHLIVVLKPRRN